MAAEEPQESIPILVEPAPPDLLEQARQRSRRSRTGWGPAAGARIGYGIDVPAGPRVTAGSPPRRCAR